jgi:putative ABC transport system substrate-binding protein
VKTLNKYITYLLIFAVFAGFAVTSASAQEKVVCVLLSRDIAPYKEALSGFKEGIASGRYEIKYHQIDFKREAHKGSLLEEEIENLSADMILCIGTEAAVFAKTNLKERPLLFTMVLNPVENRIIESDIRPEEGITGVNLNISIEDQLKAFKRVIPGIRKVGMLYDKSKKAALAREARIAAEETGLNLVARPVLSRREISTALEQVYHDSDCIWAGADPMIYNPSTAKDILLFTLKNKVPFMAFSSNFVKAGALLALESDYRDIGKQTAELASKILESKNPSSILIPVQTPRKTRLIINMNTARTLGIYISRDIQKEALVLEN